MLNTSSLERPLRRVAVHFQRSINLSYDAGNTSYVAGYIPTEAGSKALTNILKQTSDDGTQRAHVLQGPYGSGKSLLSLVLGALTSGEQAFEESLNIVQRRMRPFREAEEQVIAHREKGQRLLPVYLTGDEGTFSIALPRALTRTLNQLGLGDLRPRTQFSAAIHTIEMWNKLFPDVYLRLSEQLTEQGSSLDHLLAGLEASSDDELTQFIDLYPKLSAGAHFDSYAGVSLEEAFHQTAMALKEVGYDGLVIIWDEFGRFVEDRVNEPFSRDAADLQRFAEFCNRSGQAQVHLILVTHRELTTYAAGLPEDYQKEWARISKRFWEHDVASDPNVQYRLIAEALEASDEEVWREFVNSHAEDFGHATQKAIQYGLFDEVDESSIRRELIESAWPLHPLTVYALPRLSRAVAQNERTLFTFLAADEPYSLQSLQLDLNNGWYQIAIDSLWDYFVEGIRNDTRVGGAHETWSGAMYALSKVEQDAKLTRQIVKAIAVLTIIGDVNTQTGIANGQIIPSDDLLAWATNATLQDVQTALKTLSRRRVIVFRRSDGFWAFTRGSDVDLEAEVERLVTQHQPNPLQLRRLLEVDAPLPVHYPRGYNLARKLTRFFVSIYRWPHELQPVVSEAFLQKIHEYGPADGVVVYVLTTTIAERNEALNLIQQLPPSRVVFVVSQSPLLINESLQELFALREIQSDQQFMARDDRLSSEVEFFVDDAKRRLMRTLAPYIQSRRKAVLWVCHDRNKWKAKPSKGQAHLSRLLSELSGQWYSGTPVLNNESLNLHKPTSNQTRAAERVIDLLLKRAENDVFPFDLGMQGHGPDRLILRTMLVRTRLLQPIEETVLDENSDAMQWQITKPSDASLAAIWDEIHQFLDKAMEDEQELTSLITRLQMSPIGLRLGVLPILIAAAMRPRLHVTTVRHNRRVISPIVGETFTDICRKPEEYTVEVGEWDERRAALWRVLDSQVQRLLGAYELEQQPLSYLSLGLLRWLQSQPRYGRDTNMLSSQAIALRDLIRKAQREPAQVLLHELLDLLDDGSDSWQGKIGYQVFLEQQLSALMSEIAGSYQQLLRSLDQHVEKEFAANATKRYRDGQGALRYWLSSIEEQIDGQILEMRFSDALAQRLADAIVREVDPVQFWDVLAQALVGVSTADWNDRSVDSFKSTLNEAKQRLESELFDISEAEEIIELLVNAPGEDESIYRFRPAALSKQGQHILANFKSTMAIAGRPLSPDERRQVALAFLNFVLEGEEGEAERRNRSFRLK